MRDCLSGGIPTQSKYTTLLKSRELGELKEFSNHFLTLNKKYLKNYSTKWVTNPLNQWSRQWEYPFVFSRIQPIMETKQTRRILDAGSGISFFPYYIKSKYDCTDVYCCDIDTHFKDIFQRINSNSEENLKFSIGDLKELPYEDKWFDVIYCISVLEHTGDYEKIIEEFHRIIAPGGRLIVTFDISIDGTRDINVEMAEILLRALTERFNNDEDISLNVRSQVSIPGIFTTLTAKDIDVNLLPWKFPSIIYRLQSLITGKAYGLWPPPLTVFCLALSHI